MPEDTLEKLYCETDAAWDSFCRFPSDSTWELYVEAKNAEYLESAKIENDHC